MHRTSRLLTCAIAAATALIATGGSVSAGDPPELPDDPDAQVLNLDGTVIVYADGRVFRRVAGPTFFGFADRLPKMAPPPAPSAYEVAQLTDEGLAWLFEQADELGMLVDSPDYGDPMITDNPTATLLVTTDDETFAHSVYAPGVDVEGRDEQERREHFREFSEMLVGLEHDIDDEISDFEPWIPETWVVSDRTWFFEEPDRDWPLDEPPVAGECVVLPTEGDQDTATGAYIAPDGEYVVADAALPGTDCAPDAVTGTTES